MASESGEIIRRLVAGGLNQADIGRALGRDRSLISQVARGRKPGDNLRESLAQLESRLAGAADVRAAAKAATVTPPAPRTTRSGALARVRKPVTIRGNNWTASTVKKTGVRGGARGLGHVLSDGADAGHQVAVTVSVDGQVAIEAYGNTGRGKAGLHGSADFLLGDAADVWASVQADHGGDVTAYVAQHMADAGLVSSGDVGNLAAHIVEIDMRTFLQ